MKRYPAILGRLYNTPHLILPGKLEEIAAFIEAAQAGTPRDRVVVEGPQAYCLSPGGERAGVDQVNAAAAGDAFVAVLPLFGTMQQHADIEMEYSGGTSTESFCRQFDRLDANSAVKTIVIEAHSPGGEVYGTGEASDLIHKARERNATRIVTVVNSECASACLWVSTSGHEVYVTPGGQMGSLGVVVMHTDWSKWEEKEGRKTTLIATSAKKIAGNPFEPLSDETASELLAGAEKTMARFVAAMARNRKVSEDKVRSDFGGGGMLRADEAVKAGMADGVATMREILSAEVDKLRSASGGRGNAKANARALSLADAEQ